MTEDPNRLLLLDTNVLVHVLRDTPTGKKIDEDYALSSRLERPILCSVVEGEILGLAELLGWGQNKIGKLHELFNELVRVASSFPEAIEAYANIYADAHKNGKPRGENDVWIAATAKATGAAVLTTDKDFLWMNERHIEVHYVATE